MDQLAPALLVLLVALTSAIAYVIGARVLGLAPGRLRWAGRQTLELAGLTVVFLVTNLTIGLAVILVGRALSGRFVSVYILSDVSLVGLSALQAVMFGCWRARRDRLTGAGA
jgi:hypothetical protein